MTVITQFVVVREGVEKMTFTSKKEADAYDKMLDVVDNLLPFIEHSGLGFDEAVVEKLCFYLAENKDKLMVHLKGVGTSRVKAAPKNTKKAESKAPIKSQPELIDKQ